MTNKVKPKSFNLLKRYFMYLIFYSVGGFILERLANYMFLGEWYDNSVLIGPYQPLYGFGVLFTVIFYERVYRNLHTNKDIYKEILFIGAAIFFTGLVEAVTGWGFEWIFNRHLWDYSETFPCSYAYVCFIPTTLFGVISYLVVKYIHPLVHFHLERTSNVLFYILFTIFISDVVFSLITM